MDKKACKISRSQLDRLRKNMNIETVTINKLCSILDCYVEDIMTYYPDGMDSE